MRSHLVHGLNLVLLASITSAAHAAAPIVGGDYVRNYSDAPFMAQFVDDRQPGIICGATIIASKWVLTAGHCADAYHDYPLYAGTLELGASGLNSIPLKGKRGFLHPKYKETADSVEFDFFLIKLKTPINFSKTGIRPVALPDADFISRNLQSPGVIATTMGWGLQDENDQSGANNLLQVELPILADGIAQKVYPEFNPVAMLPAGHLPGGKDSCNGDSGGPLLVYDHVKKRTVQVGVVSFGEGCARKDYPGIYGKISSVLPWIEATMKANP